MWRWVPEIFFLIGFQYCCYLGAPSWVLILVATTRKNKPICYSVQLETFYSLQLLIYNLKLVCFKHRLQLFVAYNCKMDLFYSTRSIQGSKTVACRNSVTENKAKGNFFDWHIFEPHKYSSPHSPPPPGTASAPRPRHPASSSCLCCVPSPSIPCRSTVQTMLLPHGSWWRHSQVWWSILSTCPPTQESYNQKLSIYLKSVYICDIPF